MSLKKKKILVLSDHALSISGVGNQTRHLINGLLAKGGYTFRQFGAAIKHSSYDTIVVNEDFIIKPIDGFGNRDLIRVTLATEKPDILLIFTDPRFFTWLFEMEDEIHQICPIAWWHVWDNYPAPEFNRPFYEGTDLINCHSYLSYEIVKEMYPEKANFIPHAVPPNMFHRLPKYLKDLNKEKLLGTARSDHFTGIWINRNARRKRPSDVLESWSIFLNELERKEGHRKATLIMHTDPQDPEGPNLMAVANHFKIIPNVSFSTERLDYEKMNILHNISDFCVNISYAEGFGLSTLESMMVGNPIVAVKTGGLTRQVVDHRDGSENGVALPVELKSLVGSQHVPYIYEDYVSANTVASAFMKLYEMGPSEREKLGKKAMEYAQSEFGYQKTIDEWDRTLNELHDNWNKDRKKYWKVETI